eukprot:gene6772-6989_t
MQPNQSVPITAYPGATKETQRGTDLGGPGGDWDAEAVAGALMSRPCCPSPTLPRSPTGKSPNVVGQFLLKCRLAWCCLTISPDTLAALANCMYLEELQDAQLHVTLAQEGKMDSGSVAGATAQLEPNHGSLTDMVPAVSVAETPSAGNAGLGGATALPEDNTAAEYTEWYWLLNKGQLQGDVSSTNGLAEAAVSDEQQMWEDFKSLGGCCSSDESAAAAAQ